MSRRKHVADATHWPAPASATGSRPALSAAANLATRMAAACIGHTIRSASPRKNCSRRIIPSAGPAAIDMGCVRDDRVRLVYRLWRAVRMGGSLHGRCRRLVLVDNEEPMTPRPRRKSRNVRVEDDLWEAAQHKAGERNEVLSEVIRGMLKRYVRSAK